MEEIKKLVLSIFNKAKDGNVDSTPISIGRLTTAGTSYLSAISGLHFKEWTYFFTINPSELRHIYNDHFGDNEKDKGNNISLTDDDIAKMVDVIATPDYIYFLGYDPKKQSNKFAFLKSDAIDGTYNLMEVYSIRRGSLLVKTFFKTKKGITQRVMELQNSNSLLSTSETYSGASLFLAARIPVMLEPLPLALSVTKNETERAAKVVKKNETTKSIETKKLNNKPQTPKRRGFRI
jgi:hypothetical protein